jgi:pyrimidine-nucleoside phosphorylase
MLDLSGIAPNAVDKHSTGGVGDKTTLVVAPVVAACGVPVGKLSGRGLGFSGGTLDKLESIPGFRTDLSTVEFLEQLRDVGLVVTGQTSDLAPADGKLYALRDVTGTVQSIPLIASSVMSKKIASGSPAILLDVKVGEGAFMKTLNEARELAGLMVAICEQTRRSSVILLSDMNQPLGEAVGNAIEVREAIDTLHGGGPEDFREHCLVVSTHMLVLGRVARDPEEGRRIAEEALESGKAWERFKDLIRAQGGDVSYVEQPEKFPEAEFVEEVPSPRSGYLSEIDARVIGETAVLLGAGREKKGDPVDHAVGIEIFHKVGDQVREGEQLFAVHANEKNDLSAARERLLSAHHWSDEPVEPLPLFYGMFKSIVANR